MKYKNDGTVDWKGCSVKEYDDAKDEVIEKVILHLMHPDDFGCPRLTQDETALLMSKDKNSVLSKMTVCKDEAKIMIKLRDALGKMGIKSLSDVLDMTKGRSGAEAVRTSLCH